MRCEIRILPLAALAVLVTACDISLFPESVPVLSNVNGATTPAGPAGSAVVLAGAGFGDIQGAGRVLFTPTGGGVPLVATVATTGGWTAAAIVATVPGGAPGTYAVNVQTGGGVTSGGRLFTVTPSQAFDPSAVTWTAGPNLPGAVSGPGVAFADLGATGYVYAVGGGGAGGTPVTTVSYAAVATDGTLGAWTATTALPVGLAFPAVVAATPRNSAVIATGYLYVVGGSSSAAGTPVTTVYRAPINIDGSLGGWGNVSALPVPLHAAAAIIQYGSFYVFGGATTGNAPVATAYRSPIQVDGAVSWKTQPALPSARARFGFAVSGLYLYAFGGDTAAVAPNDTADGGKRTAQVVAGKLNPSTRDIISWTASGTALPETRSAHPAVIGTDNVLLIGGLYNGAATDANEATYAALGADGSVGAFMSAAPATSINALCSCNPFNHGATGYVAGDGTFHVLVAGGDDVSAPGTPHQSTFTY